MYRTYRGEPNDTYCSTVGIKHWWKIYKDDSNTCRMIILHSTNIKLYIHSKASDTYLGSRITSENLKNTVLFVEIPSQCIHYIYQILTLPPFISQVFTTRKESSVAYTVKLHESFYQGKNCKIYAGLETGKIFMPAVIKFLFLLRKNISLGRKRKTSHPRLNQGRPSYWNMKISPIIFLINPNKTFPFVLFIFDVKTNYHSGWPYKSYATQI